jgi:hypothetical protein
VPVSAIAQEANSNKFNSFLATHQSKQQSGTSAADRSLGKRSTTDSESRSETRRDNPVYHVVDEARREHGNQAP